MLRHKTVMGLVGVGLLATHPAWPQTGPAATLPLSGPRLIDSNRPDVAPLPLPRLGATPPKLPQAGAPAGLEAHQFVLGDVHIEGDSALPPQTLAPLWQKLRGQTVTVAQVYAIADAIGAAYTAAGYALFTVAIPPQPFDGSPVRIRVIEGFIDAVAIEGTDGTADLSLLRGYAAKITADHPLRQATLERNLLLMNAIAGLKVGSRFESIGGRPGAVRLLLTVKIKRFEYGVGFNNQGANTLGRIQLSASAAVNDLIREGDRTELIVGVPVQFNRYQYVGISHVEPIGGDGATITISLGDLLTDRVAANDISGNAVIASVLASYPVIAAVKESLTTTASFDLLNSNNAVFGNTISDENTRALRLGASYALEDHWTGIDALSGVLSEGLDIADARRGSVVYGGPAFTKLNFRVAREQPLPANFIGRLRAAAQYSPDHLPASEQFVYGGLDFGQGFEQATLFGDQGVTAAAEIAYRLPAALFPAWTTKSEIFIGGDWARIWNVHTPYQYATDSGASAGVGARTKLRDKVTVQVGAARVLEQPRIVGGPDEWRLVVVVSGSF